MSPRFKSKELILLLPVLGFIGVAFYWARIENGPSRSDITTSASHVTGGRLLSVSSSVWQSTTVFSPAVGPTPSKTTFSDMADIHLNVQCVHTFIGTPPSFNIYDIQLIDGKKKVHLLGGSDFRWLPEKTPFQERIADEYQLSPGIMLDSGFRPREPLILQGKVSIDHQWPIPFSVKLQSR